MPYRSLAPDLILFNGHIETMDARDLVATAIAIKDGMIVGVGLDDEMRELAGLGTVVEDLGGAPVIPGIIDPHNHLLSTGSMLQQVQLYDCRSIAEIQDRVAERVRTAQPGEWIVGRGWDESLLAEQRHPTRHDIDPVSPDNPVVLHRVWNKLVANSLAIAAADITAETPDPPKDELYSGSFDREPDGTPAGLFRDRAKEMITSLIPALTEEGLVRAIETACRAFHAVGITSDGEPGLHPHEIRAYDRAHREGRLTVRVDMMMAGWGFVPAAEEGKLQERFAQLGVTAGFGDAMLRLAGVKFMPDGGIGDRTARMYEPYEGTPDERGLWVVEPGQLAEMIRWVHDAGWAMDIHTCGNETQDVVVRAYVAAQEAAPKPWLRHRLHHAYLPTDEALALMAGHGIPALVSSPFLANLGESFVTSLGESRAARMMPMRSYIRAGVPLAGSSDSPITDFNPFAGMQAAVRRETVTGRVLGPDECLTPREALRSYTIGAAFGIGRERHVGSLEPGKQADLVILDRDPLAVPTAEIRSIRPQATMVGGRWVHDVRHGA